MQIADQINCLHHVCTQPIVSELGQEGRGKENHHHHRLSSVFHATMQDIRKLQLSSCWDGHTLRWHFSVLRRVFFLKSLKSSQNTQLDAARRALSLLWIWAYICTYLLFSSCTSPSAQQPYCVTRQALTWNPEGKRKTTERHVTPRSGSRRQRNGRQLERLALRTGVPGRIMLPAYAPGRVTKALIDSLIVKSTNSFPRGAPNHCKITCMQSIYVFLLCLAAGKFVCPVGLDCWFLI